MEPLFEQYIRYFEDLTPETVEELHQLVSPNFHFVDPFNDVVGAEKVVAIFGHMFRTLKEPRFEVIRSDVVDDTLYVVWDFHLKHRFVRRGSHHCIRGMSVVSKDQSGRVIEHIDYWDASSQLYSHLPVVGFFIRGLRRMFA